MLKIILGIVLGGIAIAATAWVWWFENYGPEDKDTTESEPEKNVVHHQDGEEKTLWQLQDEMKHKKSKASQR